MPAGPERHIIPESAMDGELEGHLENEPDVTFTGSLVSRPVISRKGGILTASMQVVEMRFGEEPGTFLPPILHYVIAHGDVAKIIDLLSRKNGYTSKLRAGSLVSISGSPALHPDNSPYVEAKTFDHMHMHSGESI